MKKGAVVRRKNRGIVRWTWLVPLASTTMLVACGGRTATDDGSWLDDSSLVGNGDVFDVTNAVSTVPSQTNPAHTSGTGSIGSPNPPRPRPAPPPVRPRPTPPDTPAVPTPSTTTTPATTDPITSSTEPAPTSDWPTTDDSTFTTSPTTESTTTPDPSTTWSDSTTDDSTVEPLPPFDPLHPPDGQVPLGLPPEYADAQWYDTDECFSNYGWAGSSSCYDSHYCDGASTYINCSENSAGDWACDCNAFDGYYRSVTVPEGIVPSDDTRQACRVGSALCLSDVPPTEAPDCEDYENAYPNYCSRQRVCVDQWTSSYGTFTRNGQSAYVDCSSGEDTPGVAYCSCYGASGYHSFQLSADLPEMCETGIDVCATGVEEDSLQPVECSWSSRNFGETACQQYYNCTQQGTSGGVQVFVTGQASVVCSSLGDGSWSCSCNNGGSELSPFTASSSQDACDTGGQLCIQELTTLFR